MRVTISLVLALLIPELIFAGGKKMEIRSSVFKNGGTIPVKYTCDGDDVSPPLSWSGVPSGTKSFVLIMDDPDAPMGTWVHWVIYNIPASVTSLPEAVPPDKKLKDGTLQGKNSWGRIGYGGPCPPPPTGAHRYFFKLYALDAVLKAGAGLSKDEVLRLIEGHILATAELMGKYSRR